MCKTHKKTWIISPSSYTMWHNRLGHPHDEVIKDILNMCKTHIPNKSILDFCTPCCLGKIHRLPSSLSHTTYNKQFDLICVDVRGPTPMLSTCDYKYMLTCVDAFSKYTWVFPVELKFDVFLTFRHFLTEIEVQLSTKVKVVHTDRGISNLLYPCFTQITFLTYWFELTHITKKWLSEKEAYTHGRNTPNLFYPSNASFENLGLYMSRCIF